VTARLERAISFVTRKETVILLAELLVGFLVLRSVGGWVNRIENDFGRNIFETDRAFDYAYAVLIALVLFVPVAALPASPAERKVLIAGWAAKVGATLGFALFYERRYSFLDAYTYAAAGQAKTIDLSSAFGVDGTERVRAICWMVNKTLGVGYHGTKVLFSFAGMLGVYFVYRAWRSHKGPSSKLLAILFFTPSILWWSSTLGKDPLVLLGVGLYAFGVVLAFHGRFGEGIPIAAAGFAVATFVRGWLGPVLVAPLVILALLRVRRIGPVLVLTSAMAAYFVFGFGRLSQSLGAASVNEFLQTTGNIATGFESGGSNLILRQDVSTVGGALRFLPIGAFTALFRPLPGEVNNVFGAMAGVEGGVILFFAIVAVLRARRDLVRDPVVVWIAGTVLLWSLLYAFISYYNLGTASRYRLQILPLMIVLLLHVGGWIRYDQPAPE
jgi:hypothetical protein